MSFFKGKTVAVIGSCGTIGEEIVNQLVDKYDDEIRIIGLDNNESSVFFQNEKFSKRETVNTYVCDIRELPDLTNRVRDANIIIHTAALKHVASCEVSPEQAVRTNIVGVQNVIEAAYEVNADRVLFTSSDKAVNPTNVMGTSKLMGERLITAANSRRTPDRNTIFSSTRFGNVLGSNGSVLPIFKDQIAKGNDLTLTHPDMSRFVMTTEQAVNLVLDTTEFAKGGEVFITKMPVMKIADIANVMIDVFGDNKKNGVKISGVKPGEKLYEELLSLEEMSRAIELKNYFVVLPAFRGFYETIEYEYHNQIADFVSDPYVSSEQPCMQHEEIKQFLLDNSLV